MSDSQFYFFGFMLGAILACLVIACARIDAVREELKRIRRQNYGAR